MVKLDENYRVITSDAKWADYSFYQDELDEKTERIMKLKDLGIIDENITKRLLRVLFAQYLEDEVRASIDSIKNVKKESKKSRFLFLRWINKASYA